MILYIYYHKNIMRFCLLELYILMININLESFYILIFIIIILLKEKCNDLKFVDVIIILLIYMIDHD